MQLIEADPGPRLLPKLLLVPCGFLQQETRRSRPPQGIFILWQCNMAEGREDGNKKKKKLLEQYSGSTL
jgi:hypothetical protein